MSKRRSLTVDEFINEYVENPGFKGKKVAGILKVKGKVFPQSDVVLVAPRRNAKVPGGIIENVELIAKLIQNKRGIRFGTIIEKSKKGGWKATLNAYHRGDIPVSLEFGDKPFKFIGSIVLSKLKSDELYDFAKTVSMTVAGGLTLFKLGVCLLKVSKESELLLGTNTREVVLAVRFSKSGSTLSITFDKQELEYDLRVIGSHLIPDEALTLCRCMEKAGIKLDKVNSKHFKDTPIIP